LTIPRPVTPVRAVKVGPGRRSEVPDEVATEEPMEIRVAGPGQDAAPLAVTMRTPGHDFELAAGFALTEGVADRGSIASVAYCDAVDTDDARFNTVTVRLRSPWNPTGPARGFVASASCGICGKTAIDEIEISCKPVPEAEAVPASYIVGLPERLRAAQRVFDRTGGLHAAGLFVGGGEPCCVREDIGRHNAVDKVVGYTILDAAAPPDLSGAVLAVSGRVSFEIVQKAAVAGIGLIAAVSAPSSLAVTAAGRLGVAVLGFVRGGSFNIYSHPERVSGD
jgi:FdhD protein